MHRLRSIGADIQHAVRALAQAPLFTLIALTVLTIGIGASTAVFSVVDAVVLRDLPFPNHESLAVVREYEPRYPDSDRNTTMQTFLDWRREQKVFSMFAASAGTFFNTTDAATGEPRRVNGLQVTHGFFETLGVAPHLGRAFSESEESDGSPRVLAIGHGFWMANFGGSPGAIGRTLMLDEQPWEIVAVMPEGLRYPVTARAAADVYVPARIRAADRTRENSGRNYSWMAIGRLKPGVSMHQAHLEMHRLNEALDRDFPRWFNGSRASVMSLHHYMVGDVRAWMLLLLGSVALVLLIACANVANLMLARATVRARELGIRAALGAGRWRLTRMLIVEGLVLSGAGALLGIGVAWMAVRAITASLPVSLPRGADIAIDLRVIAAACAGALVTGLLFGLLPALQSTRRDVAHALREGGRAIGGMRGGRLRSALVVGELALAVVLVIGAGLFTASFVQLIRIDHGFDYRNLMTVAVGVRTDPRALAEAAAKGPEARTAYLTATQLRNGPYVRSMMAAIRAVPGVEDVGAVNGGVPLTGGYMRADVNLPGRGFLDGEDNLIDLREVSSNYLGVLRVPLVAGRYLTEDDRIAGAKVIVINEAAAKKYWPGVNPIGQQVTVRPQDGMVTVVGVVGDLRHRGPETELRQEAYIPLSERRGASLVIRTAGDPQAMLPAIKRAIWSVNPNQFVNDIDVTLEGALERMTAERRFSMALLSLLGVLALVIAAAGVYGLMAYTVSQRRQEIGVRMALGARPADVLRMIMQNAGGLVVAGLAIGSAAAWALSTTVQRFLFLVASTDWRILALAAAVLAASAALACAIPARRAARIDPLIALRSE